MRRTGEVTAVRGENLEITFCRPADCEKCHACMGGKAQTTLLVRGQASVGDTAVVDMPAKSVLKASAIAYLVPLAGMLGGMALGACVLPFDQDAAALAGAAAGLILGVLPVALTENRRRRNPAWQPTLLQIIAKPKGD